MAIRLMGIGDEASDLLSGQLRVARELGWEFIEMRAVQVPGVSKANFHDLSDAAFGTAARELEAAGVRVYCFASAIMNWAKKVSEPFETTLAEVKRTIPRMQRLGTKYVRIMSFKPDEDEHRIPREVFGRVRDVTNMFLDAGIQPLHENCMNYGGMSWEHALELLDKCPGLKWLFDCANPISSFDRSKAKPWPMQDPWEFWVHVRDYVEHIHLKDARWNADEKKPDYTWPGEGDGRLRDILKDALARDYQGAVSLEPHLAVIFHDANSKIKDEGAYRDFVEYGRRTEALIREVETELADAATRQANS